MKRVSKAVNDQVLASLAERCVVAEARAKVSEALNATLEKQRDEAEDELIQVKGVIKQWWMLFWKARGVKDELLVETRIQTFREDRCEVDSLLETVRHTKLQSPDGPDWSWE